MTAPPEPQLDEEEQRQFDRGVDEFNRGFYFECHDTIEDLWSGLRGPSRQTGTLRGRRALWIQLASSSVATGPRCWPRST